MAVQRIEVRVRSTAAPAAVYALVRSGPSWPGWAPFTGFELERAGESGGESVGAIRLFRRGKRTTREQVVELVPDRRLGYTLLGGLPLREYRANIDLEPAGTGTEIHWHSSFRPRVPGTGWLYRWALTTFIRRCALGLAEHANHR
ncbi:MULTISPECIES: SRPBCC family protein [unclassified Crossiella]|uniref:SRPBCC family protein n=1 Tax=unclassified Crossiella TaxID=2620835 RepID=UPI001FFE3484|nr:MULTISPECIES: SRPBCC family protein [unclassified Crossiella]MCK2240859.1 SRPBCC family protein [Crossiella sp. S99.2]MCK2253997.1 SRPBCC family protein [Crossiella sp. S99.1]